MNNTQVSARGQEWNTFVDVVLNHIESYTVQQYGDKGADMATQMSEQECIKQIERYCRRFGKGARGQAEQLRDLLKVAHYACITYYKLVDDAPTVEIPQDVHKEQ